ncbi:cupredoxin domain-containing protein [Cupriavidus sp. a3]|uniref:cupredoxin domain-containing protein n=1 Tax=Cupriavidus sp. a3 TaxID=3242158 RepID=UPI003D9C580C
MKLTRTCRVSSLVVGIVLTGLAIAGDDEPEWRHRHGHGGGGVTAVGKLGDPRRVGRTITLEVGDSARFTPSTITVKRGETIRFVVKNSGNTKHEMVLGTEGQLLEFYHTRMQAPETKLPTPNAITVEAGKAGEIIWEFTRFGTMSFGCLLPGHYDAGERGTVIAQ